GADRRHSPGARGRRQDGRAGPTAWDLARDAVSLEAEVRRPPSRRCPAPQAARGREPPAETGGGGPGAQHPSAQRRLGKRVVTPAQRRTAVTHAHATAALSERCVCRYLGIHRALLRYRPRRPDDEALRAALRTLAARKRRWGVPRLCWRLQRDGWRVNHKRLERLCREERLTLRARRGRKHVALPRVPRAVPVGPDQRWSMDFVHDRL